LRPAGAGLAEDDVAAPGRAAGGGIGVGRADDQVVQSVAVDVASGGDTEAAAVVRTLAVDDEATAAIGDRGEVDGSVACPPNTT